MKTPTDYTPYTYSVLKHTYAGIETDYNWIDPAAPFVLITRFSNPDGSESDAYVTSYYDAAQARTQLLTHASYYDYVHGERCTLSGEVSRMVSGAANQYLPMPAPAAVAPATLPAIAVGSTVIDQYDGTLTKINESEWLHTDGTISYVSDRKIREFSRFSGLEGPAPKITNADRADVLRITWQLIRKSGLRFGLALKKAWAAVHAKLKLSVTDERGIWLSFRKVDGTTRHVLATRNPAYIPDAKKPKGSDKPATTCITYFDLWNSAWKSFRADSLIQIG